MRILIYIALTAFAIGVLSAILYLAVRNIKLKLRFSGICIGSIFAICIVAISALLWILIDSLFFPDYRLSKTQTIKPIGVAESFGGNKLEVLVQKGDGWVSDTVELDKNTTIVFTDEESKLESYALYVGGVSLGETRFKLYVPETWISEWKGSVT